MADNLEPGGANLKNMELTSLPEQTTYPEENVDRESDDASSQVTAVDPVPSDVEEVKANDVKPGPEIKPDGLVTGQTILEAPAWIFNRR